MRNSLNLRNRSHFSTKDNGSDAGFNNPYNNHHTSAASFSQSASAMRRNIRSVSGTRSNEDADAEEIEAKLSSFEARMRQAVENRMQRQKKASFGLDKTTSKTQACL